MDKKTRDVIAEYTKRTGMPLLDAPPHALVTNLRTGAWRWRTAAERRGKTRPTTSFAR